MDRLPVDELESCIGISAHKWERRCFEIATKAVQEGCFDGVARYGMYSGDVDDDCPVAQWVDMYEDGIPIRHGWVEQADGTIIDPTRWIFEGDYPYIAVITEDDYEHDEYDPGMQAFKSMFRSPCPSREDPRPNVSDPLLEFNPQDNLLAFVMHATEDTQGYPFTKGQIFWLANMTPEELGEFAQPFYKELEASELKTLVPQDYWQMVMRRNPMPLNYIPPLFDRKPDEEALFSEALTSFQAAVDFADKGLPIYAATRLMNAAYKIKNIWEISDELQNTMSDAYFGLYEAADALDDRNWTMVKRVLSRTLKPLWVIALHKGMPREQEILRSLEGRLQ